MAYYMCFLTIKAIFKQNKKIPKWTLVHSDFEKALFQSFQDVFPGLRHIGCFFHYSKNLYDNLKSHGLFRGKFYTLNKRIISVLRYLPFVASLRRKTFWVFYKKEIIERVIMVEIQETSERSSYVSFLYYYEKNWLAYEQLWEEFDISNVAFARTNNPAEIFNRRLNQLVIRANSKLSISLGALRICAKESKRAFVSSVSSPKKTKLTAEDHIQKIKKFCIIIDEFNRNKLLENLLGDCSELTDLEKLQEEMEEIFNIDDPDQDVVSN